MALMHPTTLVPSKLELLAAWLPAQPWFAGDPAALTRLGSYRFDDPAGEVGLEGFLLTAGSDTVYHVPLSYRSAPLTDGEEFLVGTSEHGVLGTRWFSDATGDPVFRRVLAATIAQGSSEAEEFVQDAAGERRPREIMTRVLGSGAPGASVPEVGSATVKNLGTVTRIGSDLTVLDVVRVVDPAATELQDQLSLRASWPGQADPAIVALLYTA